MATALSNATTTKSADEKEEGKDVSQLDLVFVVRAWLGCVCVGVCVGGVNGVYGRGREEEGLPSSCMKPHPRILSFLPPSLPPLVWNRTPSSFPFSSPSPPPSQVDCTGSMGTYIQAAQESIHSIITRLACDDGVSVLFGLVCYRDHAPQVCMFMSMYKRSFSLSHFSSALKYLRTLFCPSQS